MFSTVRCPVCDREFVINGRGICKCGASVVDWQTRSKRRGKVIRPSFYKMEVERLVK